MAKLKRGPLSKVENYYLLGNQNNLTPEELASDLNRSVASIEKVLRKTRKDLEHVSEETIVSQQFVRQKGVTIMTENASSMIDQAKQSRQRKNPECITKIK